MNDPLQKRNPLSDALQAELDGQEDLESKIDQLRKFKNEHTTPLKNRFLTGKIQIPELLSILSDLADTILMAAHRLARQEIHPSLGSPHFRDASGKIVPAEFALVGMGSLGGQEVHFGSDLDLIFIFNHKGETTGPRRITNREYFSKLTQRIINYLTLHTRYGYAYKVDTELRPSGQAGALVTPMGPWISYYQENAQTWEKQALLKARLIEAGPNQVEEFKGLFKRLIFLTPFSQDLTHEIHHLRIRIERELAKESEERWHFKKGYGGLVDIEFTIQYLQLKFGHLYEGLLLGNTLKAIKVLGNYDFLKDDVLKTLEKSYLFYRKLGIILELCFQLKEGYLNPKSDFLTELSHKMSFRNENEFLRTFKFFREEVRNIYLSTLEIGKE